MKKKILLFSLIAFLVMTVIAACGGAPAPEPVQTAVPPQPEPQTQTQPQHQLQPQVEPALPPQPVQEGIILNGAANHKVAKGDTLSSIAAGKYGNMFYFPLIRLANVNLISNPEVLEVNTNLVIPDLQQNLKSAGAVEMLRLDMLAFAVKYDLQGRPKSAAELRKLAANLSSR